MCSECQNWVIELNGDQLLLLSSQVENTNAYSKRVSSLKSFLTFRLLLVISKLIRGASFVFLFFRALQDVQIRFQPLHSPDMGASVPSHGSHEEFGECFCLVNLQYC